MKKDRVAFLSPSSGDVRRGRGIASIQPQDRNRAIRRDDVNKVDVGRSVRSSARSSRLRISDNGLRAWR